MHLPQKSSVTAPLFGRVIAHFRARGAVCIASEVDGAVSRTLHC